MAATAATSTAISSSHHNHDRNQFRIRSISLLRRSPAVRVSIHNHKPNPFIVGSFVGGDGSDGRNNGGGGGGDNGGEGGNGEKNRREAILVLAEMGRSMESLPAALAVAVEGGRIPAAIVERFAELEKSGVFRWLMQFGGFRERLLADDLFLAKVAMERGVGVFT